jgi:MoaA/NifB/PqqE/SkfB family radical SAM enzyme
VCSYNQYLPHVYEDRVVLGLAFIRTIERAIAGRYLAPAALRSATRILIQGILLQEGDRNAVARFREQYGAHPPAMLTISPCKSCNLRCTGCYADSGPASQKLDWDTFDRLITEAKMLWGGRFFVFSGGEPMVYRSNGKGVLDMAEKHKDCYFLMYTNGTLITDEVTGRLSRMGNLTPAVSLEGLRERTDARRGDGVFDKVVAAQNRLREASVPFGISLTATRDNCEEILSDEFVDFCFDQQGAIYGWIFQYMPIGRSFTLKLMPCPNRDHHAEFYRILKEHEPDPADENAATALLDSDYHRGLAEYDEAFEALTQPVWEEHYLSPGSSEDEGITPLPQVFEAVSDLDVAPGLN